MRTFCILFTLIVKSASIFAQATESQDLKYEFLCEVKILIDNPIVIGNTPNGNRIIYPIKGGTFEGSKIKGKILPNGGDWLLNVDSATSKLDIRATVQTDDSALVYITSLGYIHKNPDNSLYFRTIPLFETSSEKYKWLNYTIVVGVGIPIEGGVSYKYYRIK